MTLSNSQKIINTMYAISKIHAEIRTVENMNFFKRILNMPGLYRDLKNLEKSKAELAKKPNPWLELAEVIVRPAIIASMVLTGESAGITDDGSFLTEVRTGYENWQPGRTPR